MQATNIRKSELFLNESKVSRRDLVRRGSIGGAMSMAAGSSLSIIGLGGASAAAQDDKIVLNIRSKGEIVNLDPHLGSGNPDATIRDNIYSKLIYTVPEDPGSPLPDLATDWTISDDGLEYRFNLRQDAQWHKDYGQVTSADVVWTYTRVKDESLASNMTGLFSNVVETVAEGDYSVIIRLATPDPTFLIATIADAGVIGNEKAIADGGDSYTSSPVGSGPYIFQQWQRGEQAVLVKNEGHWLNEGNVDQVNMKFLLDDTVSELALRSEDLDVAYVETPEAQQAVLANPDLTSIKQPAPRTEMLWFSCKEELPTGNVDVRKALAIAIDRDTLANLGLDGMAYPAHSLFNPTLVGHLDTEFFPYDPDLAKQMLADAGFPDGFDIEILAYNEGISPDIISIIADMWGEIGVNTTVTVLERALLYERREKRDFEVLELPVARDVPEQMIYSFFTSDSAPYPNTALYSGVDDLAKQLRSEFDSEARIELYEKIQEQMSVDVPMVPVVYPTLVLGMRKGIGEFTLQIWYYPLWKLTVTV